MKNNVRVLGFSISAEPICTTVKRALKANRASKINTINVHSYVTQKYDEEFRRALEGSDTLLPDGAGIVLAARFLDGNSIVKIAGYDLLVESMSQLNKRGGSVFFLGSTDKVLGKIIARLKIDYPNVRAGAHSPPYKDYFTGMDIQHFDEILDDFKPDIVFVGLTAPKQEKLIARLQMPRSTKLVSGIGAVFDFYAREANRPSQVWIDLHLEWFRRFLSEPRRLWRRVLVSNTIFAKDVILHKIFKAF